MLTEITDVTGIWRQGRLLDVPSETTKIATRVVLAQILGSTLPPATLTAMTSHLTTLMAHLYQRMFLPPALDRLPLRGNRRYTNAIIGLRTILSRLVQNRRADRADLLSVLLAPPHPTADPPHTGHDEPRASDTEIIDQVISFFMAGSDTVAAALAWALDLLARHPGIQRRLHAEVDALPSGPARFDNLGELTLTQQVITETLRLYPPGWLIMRRTTGESRLGPHSVPAGTTVICSPYILHHRADLYPDPERFDPDRWTDRTPPRIAFIPFGGGARKCIGDTFARTELALALATITAGWNLHPITSRPPRPVAAGTLRPARFALHLTPRPTGQA